MPCQQELREQGLPYPRTCSTCGLGPCHRVAAATDKALVSRHVLAFLDNLLDPEMFGHAVTPELRRLAANLADKMRAAGLGS